MTTQSTTLTFKGGTAGYQNSLGIYQIAPDGTISNVQMVFPNASVQGGGASLVADTSSFDFQVAPGNTVGYFIVPNGYGMGSANQALLNQKAGHFALLNPRGQAGTINDTSLSLWWVDDKGQSTQVKSQYGSSLFFSDTKFNSDGLNHVRVAIDGKTGTQTIAFEDQINGGDKNFNDTVFSVKGSSPFTHMEKDGHLHIDGTAATEVLTGTAGRDQIEGGAGNDTISGGAGNDRLFGGDGNDDIHGDAGNDMLNGGAGKDVLHGDAGNDGLYGGGNDDAIYGDAGNDKLYGDGSNDLLDGGVGNDTLFGGTGNDTVTGGKGADVFAWTSADVVGTNGPKANFDHITDFSIAEGDTLDLSALTKDMHFHGGKLDVTFQKESAGFQNSVGMYQVDSKGNIVNVHILWENASLKGSGGDLVGGSSKVSVDIDPNLKVGYFIVSNGDQVSEGNRALLSSTSGHFELRDTDGTIGNTSDGGRLSLWQVNDSGQATQIKSSYGSTLFFSDKSLNADKFDHIKSSGSGGSDVTISFEDQINGGDKNFSDSIFSYSIQKSEQASLGDYVRLVDGDAGTTVQVHVDNTSGFTDVAMLDNVHKLSLQDLVDHHYILV